MTLQYTALWIGLSIYAVSFFLFAVADTVPESSPLIGYRCAYFALGLPLPWDTDLFGYQGLFEDVFDYVAVLLSGWINPIFLITVVYLFHGRHQRLVSILRIVVLLMIPFCWVVFSYHDFYPREGHFLWIIGMLLVLFSSELSLVLRRS